MFSICVVLYSGVPLKYASAYLEFFLCKCRIYLLIFCQIHFNSYLHRGDGRNLEYVADALISF